VDDIDLDGGVFASIALGGPTSGSLLQRVCFYVLDLTPLLLFLRTLVVTTKRHF